MTDVRPGQVWADNDKRSRGRYVRVVEVDATHALVEQVGFSLLTRTVRTLPLARRTRNRLNRFRPTSTGYVLVFDPPTTPTPTATTTRSTR